MELNSIPIANKDFKLEEIDGELLLYRPSDTRAVYLNQTAALVWRLCNGERRIEEIVNLLTENYPGVQDMHQQITSAINQLVEVNAIKIEDPNDHC